MLLLESGRMISQVELDRFRISVEAFHIDVSMICTAGKPQSPSPENFNLLSG
jgi:hypothetical protein